MVRRYSRTNSPPNPNLAHANGRVIAQALQPGFSSQKLPGLFCIILIADFVAPLVPVTLPLAAVFNSFRAVLGQILARQFRAGRRSDSRSPGRRTRWRHSDAGRPLPAAPAPRYGGAAVAAAALQEIGRCVAARPHPLRRRSSAPRADCAGRGTRNVEEIIYLTRGWTAAGSDVRRSAASSWTLSSGGT